MQIKHVENTLGNDALPGWVLKSPSRDVQSCDSMAVFGQSGCSAMDTSIIIHPRVRIAIHKTILSDSACCWVHIHEPFGFRFKSMATALDARH